MNLLLRRLLTAALPNTFTRWRERPAMTLPEFRAALRGIEYGDPGARALLEMALDQAAAMNDIALAVATPAAQREWYAGAAWALSNFAHCALNPPKPKEPAPAAVPAL